MPKHKKKMMCSCKGTDFEDLGLKRDDRGTHLEDFDHYYKCIKCGAEHSRWSFHNTYNEFDRTYIWPMVKWLAEKTPTKRLSFINGDGEETEGYDIMKLVWAIEYFPSMDIQDSDEWTEEHDKKWASLEHSDDPEEVAIFKLIDQSHEIYNIWDLRDMIFTASKREIERLSQLLTGSEL